MTRSVSTVDEIRRSRTEQGSAPMVGRTAAPTTGRTAVPAPGRAVAPEVGRRAASSGRRVARLAVHR
ncbi:hypothetical protein [Micromonospora psammae]|uniref:hypothetical protein n=1 Tax=Micromonospora sp. CPCC 205556 TaxID=3122398 RepID=UPI002FF3EA6D